MVNSHDFTTCSSWVQASYGSSLCSKDNRFGQADSPHLQQHHHHQQQPHQQNASHHVKYATIPHANVTQQSSNASAGAISYGRTNQSLAIDGYAKRTRNAQDPRYRSHDRMEMVSSSTTVPAAASTLPKPSVRSQSAGENMSSSGYSSYGRYTERSDSLSDDMSLLDVGAPSCDDSLEGAGDDTTSEGRLSCGSSTRVTSHRKRPIIRLPSDRFSAFCRFLSRGRCRCCWPLLGLHCPPAGFAQTFPIFPPKRGKNREEMYNQQPHVDVLSISSRNFIMVA